MTKHHRTKHHRLTDSERKQMVELYEPPSRMSMRAIGAQLGRSYGSVHRVLQAAGVAIRQRGGGNNVSKP